MLLSPYVIHSSSSAWVPAPGALTNETLSGIPEPCECKEQPTLIVHELFVTLEQDVQTSELLHVQQQDWIQDHASQA